MKQHKVLHVVRHAKASWDYDDIADIDRPLKSRGIHNAYAIAGKLKRTFHSPEKIFSSPANRALHTAIIFARVFEFPLSELEICDVLYESSADEMLDMLKSVDNEFSAIMIFGHNPDFTNLVNHFISPSIEMPTAGVVTLEFKTSDWKDIDRNNLEKHLINFPDKEQ